MPDRRARRTDELCAVCSLCNTGLKECGSRSDHDASAADRRRPGPAAALHVRHRGQPRHGLAGAPKLLGLQADARRRRHLVSHRRRHAAGFVSTNSGTTCRSPRSRRTSSTPSSPSRITASSCIPASIRSRSARARRSATSASRARVQGGSTLTQQLARTLFLSNRKSYGRKAREAVLAFLIEVAAEQAADPRAVSQSHLSRRRHLRRRSDVAAGVRQAREEPDAGGERADRRPGARAGGAVAVVESRRARVSAQPRRAGAHARRGIHHRRTRIARRARRRCACAPIAATAIRGTAMRRRTCGSGSATNSAAIIRPTGACRRRSSPRCRMPPKARWRTGSGAPASRRCRRRWSAIDPATGNILALVGGRDYQRSAFNRASRSRRQPGSAFKPFVFAAALERGMSPVSILTGLNQHRAAGTGRMDAAQRARRCARRADAASGVDRIEQSRRHPAAAAGRHAAACCGCVDAVRPRRSPRRPVAGARLRPGDAAGDSRRRSRCFPTAAFRCGRATSRACATPTAAPRFEQAVRDRARDLARGRVPDGVDAARCDRSRHRVARASARRSLPGRRQDRHDQRIQGRVVRRLLLVARRRRVGRLRSAADDRRGRLRRALRVADLGGLHAARGAASARRPSSSVRQGSRRRRSARSATASPWTGARSIRSTSRKATRFRIGCAPSIADRSASA